MDAVSTDNPRVRRWLIALCVAVGAVIFALDLVTPLGIAAGVAYIVIIVLSLGVRRSGFTVAIAAGGSALVIAGILLSPVTFPMLWPQENLLVIEIVNRVLALAAMWVMVVVVLRHMRGVVALEKEVEQRRRAERLAEDRRQEMQEFLHIVAHDLKHPLVSVQGLAAMLREDCGARLDADGRENLELVLYECGRMKDLIGRLGGIARVGVESPVVESARLDEFLRDCVRDVRPGLAQRPDIAVEVVAPGVALRFCRRHAEEAVVNLIDNAVRYGCPAPGAKVEVRAEFSDGRATVSVRDYGPGIALRDHQRVFQLFERLNPQGPVTGTGVGLAAVKRLMRRIGGEVALESEAGKGARFTLRFPATVEPGGATPGRKAGERVSKDVPKLSRRFVRHFFKETPS